MLPQLNIRPANAADLAPLDKLIAEVFDASDCRVFFRSHCGSHIPKADLDSTLVAEHRGLIVGFLLWAQDEFLGVITGVGVGATHRRFGVASLLVEAAVEKLRNEGLRVLDLVCDSQMGPCLGLFEKQQFRVLAKEGSHVLMTRRLVGGRNRGDGFDA
jgi:ribosomal protein S18 acetylase RimI-like enzyme